MKSKQIIGITLRWIVGLVFILSAITKYLSIEAVDIFVYEHKIFSWELTTWATRLLICAEFFLGLMLCIGIYSKWIKRIIIVFLLGFTAYVVAKPYMFSNVDNSNCHCFGTILLLSDKQTITKNIILIILSLLTFWDKGLKPNNHNKILNVIFLKRKAISIILFLVCFVCFNTISMAEPLQRKVFPKQISLDMKAFSSMLQMDSIQNLSVCQGKKIVCMYSTGCKYCKKSAIRMDIVRQKYNIADSNFAIIFWTSKPKIDTIINDFNSEKDTLFINHYPKVDSFFVKTQTKVLPHTIINPFAFLKATKGKQPVVLLMNNGKIVKRLKYPNINEKDIKEFIKKN